MVHDLSRPHVGVHSTKQFISPGKLHLPYTHRGHEQKHTACCAQRGGEEGLGSAARETCPNVARAGVREACPNVARNVKHT